MDHIDLIFKHHDFLNLDLIAKDNKIPNIYLNLCKIQGYLCCGICAK